MTDEESKIKEILEKISNTSTRSEKVSWKRKMQNMEKLVEKIRPIEDQILELTYKKLEVFDRIQELRNVMIRECVHPYDQLVYKGDYVECKFCSTKISIPKNG